MGMYRYAIRQADGRTLKGEIEAGDLTGAMTRVRKLEGMVLELKEIRAPGMKFSLVPKRVSLKDRIVLTEQLSVMIKAGITLAQALRSLAEESSNTKLQVILRQLVTDIEGGIPFSSALEKHPSVFSHIFCHMVRSAEKTGNLADVLAKLTVQQQKEYELKGKVKGALIYPAIVSVLLVGVIILVITFILPKLTGLFTESGVDLPLSTRFLLKLSDIFVNQWYLIIIAFVGAVAAFKYTLSTKSGALWWDTWKLKFPVLGSFIRKSYMARFTQSFASLAQAGVPVLDIFNTLQGVVGNTLYEKEIRAIADEVENGVKISVALRKSPLFPAMVGQLVSVGEQSGDLAGIFAVLGDFYEKEVDSMAKNLSTLLEPIIMIVMGAGIGFVLISVLQPIYGLVNAV